MHSQILTILQAILFCAIGCCPYAEQQSDAYEKYPLVISNEYSIPDSNKRDEQLFVKKRNVIWEVVGCPEQLRLVASLPERTVTSNCNMLFHDNHLFVAHDSKIFRVHPETGIINVYVDGVSASRLVGFDSTGNLIVLVTMFLGRVSGSDAKSYIVSFDQSGKGKLIDPDPGKTVYSASLDKSSERLAIGYLGEIKLYDLSGHRIDRVFTNCFAPKDITILNEETLIIRDDYVERDQISRLTFNQNESLGAPFSAVSAMDGLIVGLRDDTSVHIYDESSNNWNIIASIVGCDNALYTASFARVPVLSPSGRYIFLSLACHKIRHDDDGNFESTIRSLVVDLQGKSICLLEKYYEQACWR